MGQIIGAMIATLLLSMLISQFLFAEKEPIPRAVATVLTAWVLASILATFGGGHLLENVIVYGLGMPLAFWERKRHYEKHWVDEPKSEWYETFK